jgi:hypothetical protein
MFAQRLVGTLILYACASPVLAQPLAEKYLLEGKLGEGATALEQRLKEKPSDDQARAGLGVVQFLQTFEHLGASLRKYGLRTERAFRGAPEEIREILPQNNQPETLSYAKWRGIIQTAVADLARVEATLAAIKDENVKLPLHVALIKIDLFGTGKPVNARYLMGRTPLGEVADDAALQELVVAFDRGDVHWLRGYCHFLCALGEVALAVDSEEQFDCTAHLFFEKVDTPHSFLEEEPRALDEGVMSFDRRTISDIIAWIHLLRFPIKEPKRMEAALKHLEAMLPQAKEMWKHYLAETDDEHEWIPNPKQTGVMRVQVSQEMVDTWLATLDELEQVLQGKRLVPFWRGQENGERGVNVRKIFTEPRTIDPILWVQGTAATPYLEKGELTRFADPRMLGQINDTFGGANFFGFALWFQ